MVSSPRKRGPNSHPPLEGKWVPAFAGMTLLGAELSAHPFCPEGLRAGRRQNRSSGAILGEKAMRPMVEWLEGGRSPDEGFGATRLQQFVAADKVNAENLTPHPALSPEGRGFPTAVSRTVTNPPPHRRVSSPRKRGPNSHPPLEGKWVLASAGMTPVIVELSEIPFSPQGRRWPKAGWGGSGSTPVCLRNAPR